MECIWINCPNCEAGFLALAKSGKQKCPNCGKELELVEED